MNLFARHIKNRRGVALITVIWVLLALSVIAVQLCRGAKMDITSLAWRENEVKAESLARSALLEATSLLPTMKSETMSGGNDIRDTRGNITGSYTYTIVDESGRLSINDATAEEITTIMNLAGVKSAGPAAARLLEMRDKYPGGGPVFAGEFLSLEGMDRDLFYGEDADDDLDLDPGENDGDDSEPADDRDGELDFGLRRHIRVSCGGKVNINLATREALMTVTGSTSESANSILTHVRETGGGATMASMKNLPLLSETISDDINIRLTDRSECFRVRAEGASGSAVRVISAYYRVNPDGSARLLHWWEP